MTVISKELFYERIDDSVKCSVVHFWEPNCFKASFAPYFPLQIAKGSAKFFIPIYTVKLLLNYKKIKDKNFLKDILMSQCKSMLYGIVMASLIVSTLCLLRKICGRLHYYNLLFLPGVVSGLSVLVESEENQALDCFIFFNSFVEATIRNLNFFNIFKITKRRETLMFMATSSILMYLLENRRKKIDFMYFWFYTPSRRKNSEIEESVLCSHSKKCFQFFYQGFLKYFLLGYLVNALRKLLSKMGILAKRPSELLKILFNKANFKFGLFIGSYVGLYRVLTCYLTRTGAVRKKLHGPIAGFLSGLTYIISPNLQVLVIGITTLLQFLYEYISNKLNIKKHFWQRQILFMFCHGALLHNKVFCPETCPSYYKNMIDACTNNVIVGIYNSVIPTYFL